MNGHPQHLSSEEALELQKIRLRSEMQDEITAWAKKRFTVLGVVVAILGFFGLSTVLNQSLQVLVTKPVERELVKLDQAKERASAVIAELTLLSSNVGEQGRNAEAAAEAATKKIKELESSIAQASRDAQEIEDKFRPIREGMSRVSSDIFSLASTISEEERLLEIEIKMASETLNALESLSTAIAQSFRTTQVDAALSEFRARTDAIRADHKRAIAHIAKIRSFNVVFYITRGEDDEMAQAAVRDLKSKGYRAAVWYTNGVERNAVVSEIAGEFGQIGDILRTNPSGIVSHPQHQEIAAEIEYLLSSRFKTNRIDRALNPIEQHLIHDQGLKTFESDRVILIYLLGPEEA